MNAAAKAASAPRPPPPPSFLDVGARFPPSRTKKCELYKGRIDGYVFKGDEDGVGYYRDLPKILPLEILVPESDYHLYRFNARQWQLVAEAAEVHRTKRARRQRHANGTRKKKKTTRRELASRR